MTALEGVEAANRVRASTGDGARLLDIRVDGTPVPQGSKRYLGVGAKGKVRMAESSPRVPAWRADIGRAIEDALPPDQAVEDSVIVELTFVLARPKSHLRADGSSIRSAAPRHPAGRPDLDKLVRAVLDAIGSSGRVWRDDSQVVAVHAVKSYAFPGTTPGVFITVRRTA